MELLGYVHEACLCHAHVQGDSLAEGLCYRLYSYTSTANL